MKINMNELEMRLNKLKESESSNRDDEVSFSSEKVEEMKTRNSGDDEVSLTSEKVEEIELLKNKALNVADGVLEENTKYKLTSESCDLRNFISESKKHAENLANSYKNGEPLERQEYYLQMYREAVEKADKTTARIHELISNSKINLISDIEKLITEYKEYLATLNVEQLCHLITITSTCFILICFFNVIVIMFADKLIDYFNLELRFPKIARIIRIRKNLNKFSIYTNLLLIFIVLLFILYVNFITLLS